MRLPRLAAAAIAALLALVVVGHWSGDQPDRDELAAARQRLGLDLEAGRVQVDGVHLFVVQAGPADGPPVVLLHGFPELWYAWAEPMAHLARAGYRVIVPDQRGYNRSDKPRGAAAYRVDLLAGDVAGLIAALGYRDAFVAAHDWGGAVAWRLALRHPERVRKLVVIDTPHPQVLLPAAAGPLAEERDAGEGEGDAISWYRTFFQIPWLPEWTARLGDWFVPSRMLRGTAAPGAFPDEKLELWRSAWDREGAFGSMVDWYRAARRYPEPLEGDGRVAVPTLLLLAPDDAFIPSALTRRSLAYLDHGRLLELASGTHWVIQEDPEGLARILAGFFAE